MIGSGKGDRGYGFTPVSPNRQASEAYSSGVVIEYEGDDVRKFGEPVKYDLFWRNFGEKSETDNHIRGFIAYSKENKTLLCDKIKEHLTETGDITIAMGISYTRVACPFISVRKEDKEVDIIFWDKS